VTLLDVTGMTCGNCARHVTEALQSVAGVKGVFVQLETGRARVSWDGLETHPETLIQAVEKAGYEAKPVDPPKSEAGTGAAVTLLDVTGMTCGNCVRKVTEVLQAVPGVGGVIVEQEKGRARIHWKGSTAQPGALLEAVEKAGYEAKEVVAGANAPTAAKPGGSWNRAVWIGLPVLTALILAEWGFGLGMNRTYQWVAFLAVLPVQLIVGREFYVGAWRQANRGQSSMDTLVALGSTAAFGFSVWRLLGGSPGHLYFMESASILTLVSLGHWLEARMTLRATDSLRTLLTLAPERARKIAPSGTGKGTLGTGAAEMDVPVSSLVAGDFIALRPGDRIPVDAVVVEGTSSVEEAMLTGEPIPIEKGAGASLYAGTANQTGRLVARVTATGEKTALAGIIGAVQRAQSSRAGIQRLADRISSIFVPIVVVIAAAAGLAWGLGYPWMSSVHEAIGAFLWHVHPEADPVSAAWGTFAAVLIVACPCAMGLATPAALMAGMNAAARRGILIRDAVALEKSGRVGTVIFDKTGTLTEGKPKVTGTLDLRPATDRIETVEALAAALAESSTHPFSRAVANQPEATVDESTRPKPVFHDWRELRGRGIEARRAGAHGEAVFRLGSAGWMAELGIPVEPAAEFLGRPEHAGATPLYLGIDGLLAGIFLLKDALRPGARELVAQLQRDGLKVRMLTGDREGAATAIGKSLGLNAADISWEVRPETKAEVIRKIQASGERVAFVGDGLNDGPALAQADLGIAVASATDVARDAADIILLRADLAAVPQAIGLARATLRVIHQNLFWAFFYNAAAIPLAAFGFISPFVCAAAMGLSDVIVVGNALRLRRK
jgi:Cu+-exporting ATPase